MEENKLERVIITRRREHYKAKYLTLRGWVVILIPFMLFFAGVALYNLTEVNRLKAEIVRTEGAVIVK